MLPAPVDIALDRLVAPGYSRIGYALRARGWESPAPDALAGRTAVVTGASSGIGEAAARGLAALGAAVHVVVRNRERGERACERVAAQVPGAELHLEICDVSDLGAVRACATGLAARIGEPHLLVHNAGVLLDRRTETAEGNEVTVATHVLGPHLLTALLPARRTVWVSSGGMYTQRLRLDDLQYRQGDYRGATAYARAKRAQVVLAEAWGHRREGSGAVVHSMHPGWVDTPGLADSLAGFHRLARPLLRTPAQGADTIVWLGHAEEPGRCTARFWHDRRPRPTHVLPFGHRDAGDANALWQACEALTRA